MRLVVLTKCLLAVGCAATFPSTPQTSAQWPTLEIVARSDHCQLNKPSARLFKEATHAADIIGKRVDAGIDPDHDVLVLIALGTRATPGYGVTLMTSGQAPANGTLDLPVDYTEPAPDAILPQVLTTPCALVAVRQTAGVRTLTVPLYDGGKARLALDTITR